MPEISWEILASGAGGAGGWVVAWNIWKAYQDELKRGVEREREHRDFIVSAFTNRGGGDENGRGG